MFLPGVLTIHPEDLERMLEAMNLSEQREKLDNTILRLAEELFPERFKKVRLEGEQQGKLEGKLETAVKMLAEGLDETLIAKVTGLSSADIAALKKK